MRGKGRVAIVAAVFGAMLAVPGVAAADRDGLAPGGLTDFDERVTVNVVFVGIDENEAPWRAVRAELPSRGEPIVRSRAFYGIDEPLGLDYSYDYRPYYTSRAWEDAFFSSLSSIAVSRPLTEWQRAYNAQAGVLDVTDNRWIDAPTVEKRLIDTAPPGVDTRRPTIFFIDWHGRSDFRFHVYSKTGEPDPDTGKDFGAVEDDRKIVAWGGTTPDDEETGLGRRGVHRVWFYDLSAGPEAWGGNFEITTPDIDGDGEADYRIPVSWEYGHYRPRSALPGDLGKVIRYVGLDLLFTSSPLYPPYFTADRLPDRVDLDVNTVEGLPGVDASRQYVKRDLFFQEELELPAGFSLSQDYQDLPFAGDFRRCFEGEFRPPPAQPVSCFPQYRLPPDANLFLAAAFNRDAFLEGDGDYEAALINYATPNAPTPLGYADDNWIDGTQSGVFSFVSPGIVEAGYGLTTTMIHEYGHHSSMSHPHDGYDPETGTDFAPTGDFFFAWLGDESNSMMSYIDVNWDFSQFDRDNSARHHGAGYALIANRVAADILRDRDRRRAERDLEAADRSLRRAQDALESHDYNGMLAHAASAYRSVRAGAAKAGVKIRVREPSTWTVVGAPRSRMEPSTIDLGPIANRKRGLREVADHHALLGVALAEARAGMEEGGIPIGGALFDASGALLGRGHNQRVQRDDPSAHGETEAFRNAGRRRSYRDTTMATTLAPCWYCSGLIRQFGIGTVVVGESRTFRGGIDWLRESGVEVVDLDSAECAELLGGFIERHPEVWNEDIGE